MTNGTATCYIDNRTSGIKFNYPVSAPRNIARGAKLGFAVRILEARSQIFEISANAQKFEALAIKQLHQVQRPQANLGGNLNGVVKPRTVSVQIGGFYCRVACFISYHRGV